MQLFVCWWKKDNSESHRHSRYWRKQDTGWGSLQPRLPAFFSPIALPLPEDYRRRETRSLLRRKTRFGRTEAASLSRGRRWCAPPSASTRLWLEPRHASFILSFSRACWDWARKEEMEAHVPPLRSPRRAEFTCA